MNWTRHRCALLAGLLLWLLPARAQDSSASDDSVSSVSGQFVVTSVGQAPAFRNLNPDADTNLVELRPALLAVAAERFKLSLREQLGIPVDADWSGKIYLRIHPATSLDETVTITALPFLNHCNYEVDLPDVLWKTRYARAMSGVLLLELANRSMPQGGHSAELPPWLVDGLAEQVLAVDGDAVVLSAPIKKAPDGKAGPIDYLPVNRSNQTHRGVDALALVRQALQTMPVLTFDELSWPTDSQMDGLDGGAYFASAQYFIYELLQLKDGREQTRVMLADLPNYYNWQTAFFHAFAADFQRPLDVEKWWSLRVVTFAARAPGSRWTTDVSTVRLQQILSVPVDYRGSSNALPMHAEISLQNAIRSLGPGQADQVLRTKIRDLALVEFRLAPPFGNLADGYRQALADYLGESHRTVRPSAINKHGVPNTVYRASVADTLKALDLLDARRRDAEAKSMISLPGIQPPAQ